MKLVSVCIPCHNAAPYLRDALDSVLAQTWENLEVIVVDDGSTDGSREILECYCNKGIQTLYEDFGSAAKSRNKALEVARGDFIKFFDADDLLSPSMIENQMDCLGGDERNVASCKWGRFYNDELATLRLTPEKVWRDMKGVDWLVEAWSEAKPMTQPGIFLIPRKIIEQAGGWDEDLSLIDDFEFFARILSNTSRVIFSEDSVLCYRSGNLSLSSINDAEAVKSAYLAVSRGTEVVLRIRNDRTARRSCANLWQSFLFTYYPESDLYRDEVERNINSLGGSDLRIPGSSIFSMSKALIGWRLAIRIRRRVQQAKARLLQ